MSSEKTIKERVWDAVVDVFMEEGRAVRVQEAAKRAGVTERQVRQAVKAMEGERVWKKYITAVNPRNNTQVWYIEPGGKAFVRAIAERTRERIQHEIRFAIERVAEAHGTDDVEYVVDADGNHGFRVYRTVRATRRCIHSIWRDTVDEAEQATVSEAAVYQAGRVS
jgi:DNA-binding Lrp family transcriptional regulator